MKSKLFRTIICLVLASMLVLSTCAFAATTYICSLTVNGARVRNSAGEIIGHANKGLKVIYGGKKIRSNSLVRAANGKEGYIYDGFLEVDGKVETDDIYYCNVKSSTIYGSPSTNARKLGSMKQNQYVVLLQARDGWGYVRNLNGAGGFCKLSDITKA